MHFGKRRHSKIIVTIIFVSVGGLIFFIAQVCFAGIISVENGNIITPEASWQAFPGWYGVLDAASGDLNGNGYEEIVAAMGQGGGPHVRIFSAGGRLLGQFDAYHPDFRGGINLAVGDINSDGKAEIVTGAGMGGGPHVRVFNERGELISQWFAGPESERNGVDVWIEDGKIITSYDSSSNPGAQVFEMAVPFHKQEHTLSCEVASLKSALSYKGVNISELELIKLQPISYPLKYSNGVWGDPSRGYVGDIDGSQPRLTGYGIYWKPIAELARSFRPAESFRHVEWRYIRDQIEADNVIIIWGNYVQNPRTLIWETSEGAGVLGFIGEHTYVVLGWEGDPDHPDTVILLDPMRGRLKMTYSEFMRNWSFLDYSGVVVK